ncbi:MAG: hypothetical protein K2X93_02445 [Candidatus Obscuribacterales bacterium]|nr:hypothetical protein [Candidatus Obscuribacterales bacterium]
MSQTNSDANDLAIVVGGAAGSAARTALSNEFAAGTFGKAAADLIKNLNNGDSTSPPQSDNGAKPSHKNGSSSDSSPAPSDTTNPGQKPKQDGGLLNELLGQTKPSDKNDRSGSIDKLSNKVTDAVKTGIEKGGQYVESFMRKVTDADRKEAKDALEKSIDPVIKGADRQTLKDLQAAIIDGNAENFAKALKPLAGKPEELASFLKSLNKQLSGVELSTDSKGNVLVYEKGGNTAVSVNPATGATEVRPIERQSDGSIVLKPGEIINRNAKDVMKTIGDEATRDIVMPRSFNKHWDEQMIRPLDLKNRSGGGGGGDSGILPNLNKLLKPSAPSTQPKPGDSK